MIKEDLLDLNNLIHCEFVRYVIHGSDLQCLFIADNEEGQKQDYHNDEESCDCCDGLNGHLYSIIFSGVTNFKSVGEECDNYKTLKVIADEHHFLINLEGINFFENNNNLSFSFDYETFVVKDSGEILGPSA